MLGAVRAHRHQILREVTIRRLSYNRLTPNPACFDSEEELPGKLLMIPASFFVATSYDVHCDHISGPIPGTKVASEPALTPVITDGLSNPFPILLTNQPGQSLYRSVQIRFSWQMQDATRSSCGAGQGGWVRSIWRG